MTSSVACLCCWGPVDPDQPRWLAFAQAGMVVHVVCCGGCRTPSNGGAGTPATHPKATP